MHPNRIKYVNVVMAQINGLTDEIYEALIDEEFVDLTSSVNELEKVLTELKALHNE